MKNRDEFFMKRSLALAKRGRFGAHPNPMVGAVAVKGRKIISEGWHRKFGGPHAEVIALQKAGKKAREATLYVTLEPCSTRGKTLPCVDAIARAGIKRVVTGASDPNPLHDGRGEKALRRLGLEVKSGVLREKCEKLIAPFAKFITKKIPYVVLKTAQSLDGKTADYRGNSRWISSLPSRIEGHRLRAEADCVLCGVNTILRDDPLLNVRHVRAVRRPAVAVLDSSLKLKGNENIFRAEKIFIFTTGKADKCKMNRIRSETGSEIVICPRDESGMIDLKYVLKKLGERGVSNLLVEGGGRVSGSFIVKGLFDRIIVFIAPLVVGGERSKTSAQWPDALSAKAKKLGRKVKITKIGKCGPDIVVEAECFRG